MKTIGSRLTVLYVAAVGGTLIGILVLGYLLLARNLVAQVDASLRRALAQVQDRIGADAETQDAQALLAVVGLQSSFSAEVQDLWDNPAYRAARTSGTDVSLPRAPHCSTVPGPDGRSRRMIELTIESVLIRLFHPLDDVDRALADYVRWGGGLALLALAASWGAGLVLSHTALAPVRDIERTAARITSQNLGERIPVPSARDEISNLARLLNATFDRLQASFTQIDRFSADASHELKTPLAIIRLNLERAVLHDRLDPADRSALQDAIEEIHHLDRLIENLLFLARAASGEVQLNRRPLDTTAFIEHLAQDVQVIAESAQIVFAVTDNEPMTAHVDADRVRQVLLNLLSNAFKFSATGQRVELSSRRVNDSWRLAVTDEGPGVPDAQLEQIFHRFSHLASSKPDAPSGTGLGLAISRTLAELHQGTLRARRRADGPGLIFECLLPLSGP